MRAATSHQNDLRVGHALFSRRLALLFACVALAVSADACRRHEARFKMRTVDAGNGVTLDVPDGFQVRRTGQAIRVFSPARERTRSPVDIVITTVAEQPDLSSARVERVGERAIHYAVGEEPGGSGGDVRRLRAWVQAGGDRFIVLDSWVQPDSGGDGDFRVEWAILPTLRWQPPK
jgi:hypothetical protein